MLQGLIYFGEAFVGFLTPLTLVYVLAATQLGIIVGMLPGLTATLPPTFDDCGGTLAGSTFLTYTSGSVPASTTCSISVEPEPLPGAPWSGDDGADVVAECGLDLAALGAGSGS